MERTPPPKPDEAPESKAPSSLSPIEDSWSAFERLATAGKMIAPERQRMFRHAFYAGARSAFNEVLAAMQEEDAGDPAGVKRFATIEREIDEYFREAIGRGMIARSGGPPS